MQAPQTMAYVQARLTILFIRLRRPFSGSPDGGTRDTNQCSLWATFREKGRNRQRKFPMTGHLLHLWRYRCRPVGLPARTRRSQGLGHQEPRRPIAPPTPSPPRPQMRVPGKRHHRQKPYSLVPPGRQQRGRHLNSEVDLRL